jgi:ribosomal protein L7/L12
MCGGDVTADAQNPNVGVCDSCGSTMTLPSAGDDRRANLFNRANNFRLQNEFDKALTAYENVLNEDDNDAEAHWGAALSRFGVEYVEDPRSHERVPTIHRVQYEPFLRDADYLAAIEHAPDGYSRSLYEKEGQAIAEIQRDVLALAANEQPFDVFICYKETMDGGSRTKDSVDAQEIYQQLTDDGYKVFFARITLEDKLGSQYEPVIFSALNSAKVMLVVGSQPKNFNAAWVKNEWSRFIALAKKDRAKLLIPCYRDMDAYDLPDELSIFQSQDMSKIGFMQDLIRGVKKVLDVSRPAPQAPASAVTATAATPGVESLYKRTMLFLEDGDWTQAEEYCDRILDIDPEYAPAYVGKLCAELKCQKEEEIVQARVSDYAAAQTNKIPAIKRYREEMGLGLVEAKAAVEERIAKDSSLDSNKHFKNALRFADAALRARLEGYAAEVVRRIEENRRIEAQKAEQERLAREAAQKEEEERIRQQQIIAERLAEEARLEAERKAEQDRIEAERQAEEKNHADYQAAYKNGQIAKSAAALSAVAAAFRALGDYHDSAAQTERFDKLAAEKKARLKLCSSIAVAAIAILIIITLVVIQAVKYRAAEQLLANGRYDEAIAAFEALGDYRNAQDLTGQALKQQLSIAAVGSTVTFGDFEWRVLDRAENKLLIITNIIVKNSAYNEEYVSTTWAQCTLREYLNGTFYNEFSDAEKALIADTNVVNADNPNYDTDGGNDTTDKIFLLSIDEANKYFKNNADRAIGSWSWLRSPGHNSNSAAIVASTGYVSAYGYAVIYTPDSVRPAMWVVAGE